MAKTTRRMNRSTARAVVITAVFATAAANAVGPASATEDPSCLVAPYLATCLGTPPDVPTSPSDPECATSPADAVCSGGPYAPPNIAPSMGSQLPGSLNPDGTPFGSEPISGMPGSIPGMPGIP